MFYFNMFWDLFIRCVGERTDCQIFSKLFLQDKKRFIHSLMFVVYGSVIVLFVCLFASACRWCCLAAQLSWLPLPVVIQADSLELVLVEVSVQQAAKKNKNHSWFVSSVWPIEKAQQWRLSGIGKEKGGKKKRLFNCLSLSPEERNTTQK